MCLAIPGRIVKRTNSDSGVVDFGGVTKEISLVFVPEAKTGDWIIMHAGFALERISEKDALSTISILKKAGELVSGK